MKKIIFFSIFIMTAVFLTGCANNYRAVTDLNYEPEPLFGDGQLIDDSLELTSGEACISEKTGAGITIDEAYQIAQDSACVQAGAVKKDCNCNQGTGTCWLTMEGTDKPGCAPACVVNVETKSAEINWRCSGLMAE